MTRPRRARPRAALAPLILAITAAGCSGDFDPYGRLTALRVLAVQSEPVAPGPGASTTLTPLVYTSPGDTVTSLAWSWCPFAGDLADGAPCLLTEAELRARAGDAGAAIPPYDLGTGPTATFAHTVPTELLDALCDGSPTQPALVDCEGGFPVQIRLVVRTATASVDTVRTLRLRRDGDPGNANPSLDGLAIVDGNGERPLGDDATISLPREVDTELRAAVAETAAESYPSLDSDDQPITAREHLLFTWFVESGDTDAERTGFIDGVEPLADAVANSWQPAPIADYPRDTARLLVVLRDDRDGVSWRTATVRLDGAP
jgi:hypothetical protein